MMKMVINGDNYDSDNIPLKYKNKQNNYNNYDNNFNRYSFKFHKCIQLKISTKK